MQKLVVCLKDGNTLMSITSSPLSSSLPLFMCHQDTLHVVHAWSCLCLEEALLLKDTLEYATIMERISSFHMASLASCHPCSLKIATLGSLMIHCFTFPTFTGRESNTSSARIVSSCKGTLVGNRELYDLWILLSSMWSQNFRWLALAKFFWGLTTY